MFPVEDTRSRSSVGTVNFAAALTVPKAIEFHRGIGGSRKQRHLQSFRDYWVERVRDIPGMQILTPDDTARHGAVSSFRLPAMRDYARAQKMATLLLEKHRVLTVARTGIARGSCPGDPHAVQHAPGTRPSGGGAPPAKRRLRVMPSLPRESAQPEVGWSSPSAASAAESLPRLVMPRRG
ncbi:aminotransferase class V-fold PLP-dependent enzyme [Streptomyces tendae]|uniref:aminotransferase class V-fold PLP-dependent enzyme n=1 Tax=Streptomyces tendae TaxID=1932 RepID=UPI003CD0CB1A